MTEQLAALLPGFSLDKDEDWMKYLSAEEQSYIRKQRYKFLLINEQLDNFRISFQKYLEDNKSLIDTVEVRRQEEEFIKRRNDFLSKREQNAKNLIPRIKELRKEALRLMSKRARREQLNGSARKRPRIEEPNLVEIDSDVDFVEDDYLPNLNPDYSRDIVEPVPMETATTPPMSPKYSSNNKQKLKKQSQDKFLIGCDEMEIEILPQLKSLINKYNCRDRVIRAIRSFKSRDKSIRAMEIFTKSIAMAKEDPKFRS